MKDSPNIVIIMTDQQRADACAREGFPLDTTPFLDGLAREGVWFDKAYTTNPVCAPARVSMLTGRYPAAAAVRTNHNLPDVRYEKDLIDVLREHGCAIAMCGKNHSHLTPERTDHWFNFGHGGGAGEDRTPDEKAFDEYMSGLHHRTNVRPAPFGVECQGPHRTVSDAIKWIAGVKARPFFLWLSFPEPHNPFQVCEPYFSMFPVESLPPVRAGAEARRGKGFKYEFTHEIGRVGISEYDEQIQRTRANYYGMLRLIDDQVRRFVEFLEQAGLRKNTIIVFLSDHGDFAGEYGLIRKGPDLPECLVRIPLIFAGPGIAGGAGPHAAHVSIADVMPTLCEAVGRPLPVGVQGRSLWPMLAGGEYPAEEFASAYAEHGFGGLHYTADDELDPVKEGAINPGCTFDCLNSWTQSGTTRMLRMGDWKLIFDMQGRGELYNLADDPAEINDLFGHSDLSEVREKMLAELLAWTLRTADPLPLPRRRYIMKTDPRNYWRPHR